MEVKVIFLITGITLVTLFNLFMYYKRNKPIGVEKKK